MPTGHWSKNSQQAKGNTNNNQKASSSGKSLKAARIDFKVFSQLGKAEKSDSIRELVIRKAERKQRSGVTEIKKEKNSAEES